MNRIILNETSYFGAKSREAIKDEVKQRGFKKALLVTDQSVRRAGVTEKVEEVLKSANLDYVIYDGLKPNPTVKNVKDGLNICKEANADYIIAVGGGSTIDTAKAISIIMTNPEHEDVVSLDGAITTKQKGLPLIALPTTSGTAAEVTINYVITDTDRVKKMVCVDPHDIPIIAIIDSELMAGMPASVAASTGMDALTHAMEGYITKAAWTMTDMFHLQAMKLIYENLEKAVNEHDQKAIENMGLAQYIAGMGFSNVGLGIVHSMAHSLGALYDTPHGVANALLLPHVLKYNGKVCAERFKNMATAFGLNIQGLTDEEVVDTVVDAVNKLARSVHIPATLREVNVKEEDFMWLATQAYQDVCTPGNPRTTSIEDIVEIYKEAY
jgi:lactaldehyde reductase